MIAAIAVPAGLAVLYGLVSFVLRDRPPERTCEMERSPAAVLDAYRSGIRWLATACVLVAAGLLYLLSSAASPTGRPGRPTVVALSVGLLLTLLDNLLTENSFLS